MVCLCCLIWFDCLGGLGVWFSFVTLEILSCLWFKFAFFARVTCCLIGVCGGCYEKLGFLLFDV